MAETASDRRSDSVPHAVRRSLSLLNRRDRRTYVVVACTRIATSALDLVGVLLMGAVGVLLIDAAAPEGHERSIVGTWLSARPSLSGLDDVTLAFVVGIVATCFLVTKSLISAYLNRRVLRFLAVRQSTVSDRLTADLLSRPLQEIQRRSSQELGYALVQGVNAATVGLLGALSTALAEVALLLVLGITLLVIDPLLTLGAIAFLAVVGVIIQRSLATRAGRAATLLRQSYVSALEILQETLASYREISVSSRRDLFRDEMHATQRAGAMAQASAVFIQQVPKYVLESALVIGTLALAASQIGSSSPAAAAGTVALFLAAGSRVLPSMLRMQGALLSIRTSSHSAVPTYELAEELARSPRRLADQPTAQWLVDQILAGHPGFTPTLQMRDVSYCYPGASNPALIGASLEVAAGARVAVVGRSGAGKSTLADLLLGVREPTEGSILIGGLPPADAISRWPGGTSYVPQKVALLSGSVRDNILLGLPRDLVDDSLVWDVLEQVHLDVLLREQRDGLDTVVGEAGLAFSGGQQQRIGIARALVTRPRLIVLDEATSALDAETERTITTAMRALGPAVTTVTIAHRLATVRSADLVAYLDEGRIVAQGGFDEVRRQAPGFDVQATILGL